LLKRGTKTYHPDFALSYDPPSFAKASYKRSNKMMIMKTSELCIELQQPHLWQVDETGVIANEQEITTYLDTYTFIASNAVWIQTHQPEARIIANLLAKTKFTDQKLQRSAHINSTILNLILKSNQTPLKICTASLENLSLQDAYVQFNVLKEREKKRVAYILERIVQMKELLSNMKNLFPRVEYADIARSLKIDDCCLAIRKNLTHDLLPGLLEKGLELELPQLIWTCLTYAMDRLEQSKTALDNFSNLSKDVALIFEELKICAELPSPPLFLPNGWMVFEKLPENPLFQTLGTLFPISVQYQVDIRDRKSFTEIFDIFPHIQNLTVGFVGFKNDVDIDLLKTVKSLKSFGNVADHGLKSKQDVENYINQLSPITLSDINFGAAMTALTCEDLEALSPHLNGLIHLIMRYSNVTSLPPSIQPEYLVCSGSDKLEKLHLTRAKIVNADRNYWLTEVIAPELEAGYFYECHRVKEFSFPKAKELSIVHCGFEKLIAPQAQNIDTDKDYAKRNSIFEISPNAKLTLW
jgi:hypothetical protein